MSSGKVKILLDSSIEQTNQKQKLNIVSTLQAQKDSKMTSNKLDVSSYSNLAANKESQNNFLNIPGVTMTIGESVNQTIHEEVKIEKLDKVNNTGLRFGFSEFIESCLMGTIYNPKEKQLYYKSFVAELERVYNLERGFNDKTIKQTYETALSTIQSMNRNLAPNNSIASGLAVSSKKIENLMGNTTPSKTANKNVLSSTQNILALDAAAILMSVEPSKSETGGYSPINNMKNKLLPTNSRQPINIVRVAKFNKDLEGTSATQVNNVGFILADTQSSGKAKQTRLSTNQKGTRGY